MLGGGVAVFEHGGGFSDGALGLVGEELFQALTPQFRRGCFGDSEIQRGGEFGRGGMLGGHELQCFGTQRSTGGAIGDDLLQHGRFDAELELHEKLDRLGLEFTILNGEQGTQMRLNEGGEGFFIAWSGFVGVAVDAVQTWRLCEGEQHVQRFALQLRRLQCSLDHGFRDAEPQAGIQAATRATFRQRRKRFRNAGVVVNGPLSFIGQGAVGEEISNAGRMLTREGEQAAQRGFVLHMRGEARFAGATGEAGHDGVAHERIGAFLRGHGEEIFLCGRLFELAERDGGVEADA